MFKFGVKSPTGADPTPSLLRCQGKFEQEMAVRMYQHVERITKLNQQSKEQRLGGDAIAKAPPDLQLR